MAEKEKELRKEPVTVENSTEDRNENPSNTPEQPSEQVENASEKDAESENNAEKAVVEENPSDKSEEPTNDQKDPAAPEVTTEVEVPEEESESPEGKEEEEPVKEAKGSDQDEHHDDHHDDHESDHEEVDYGSFSTEKLIQALIDLNSENDLGKVNKHVKEIRESYDDHFSEDRKHALEKFVADGGKEDEFEFKGEKIHSDFEKEFSAIKSKISRHFKELEGQKENNYTRKTAVLEELRHLIDSEETTASFKKLKAIQEDWKAIGPVPRQHSRTLWANYNALIHRFYDNRSIYFELKELDRKKNLESKIKLCEKAEVLAQSEDIREAVRELNELHHEFKHIGPVPREDQEALWTRFKTSSDAIYAKRKTYLEEVKSNLNENLEAKSKLGDEVADFSSFDSTSIGDWNKKTQEILNLQKRWDAIGGLPKNKAKEINKKFWSGFKSFFQAKHKFFKNLEGEREENLKKKVELIEKAEAIKDSTDWDKTAEELKQVQRDWKEIGPVPKKQKDEIFKRFKAACDHFFDARRGASQAKDVEYEKNLKEKEAVIKEINALAKKKSGDLDKLHDLEEKYGKIGFVPRKAMGDLKKSYSDAINNFLDNTEGLNEEEIVHYRAEAKMMQLTSGPNSHRKIVQKEQSLRKQISKVENEIATWRNNLEFFANSKTADSLRSEYEGKIQEASNELDQLKEELRILSRMD